MTEGNGHLIDPAGDARRALQAVVAEHGPEALSNAVIMDGICQARLSDLPGEAILIGSAARTDVPTLLRDLIPRLGNYGAIQSVVDPSVPSSTTLTVSVRACPLVAEAGGAGARGGRRRSVAGEPANDQHHDERGGLRAQRVRQASCGQA